MWLIYKLLGDYGWSLILFTVLMQLAMLPLTINQKKSMAKNTALQPQLENLRKKYANNPNKLNEEQQKIYEENGHSMTSGCMGMLIQFPVLFGLMDVIYRPLTHIVRISKDVISAGIDIAGTIGTVIDPKNTYRELMLIGQIKADPSAFSALGADNLEKIIGLNLTIFGLDSTVMPEFGFNLLAILPIISALTSMLQMIYNQRIAAKSAPDGKAPGGSGMMMTLLLSPLMSLVFAYQFPIGVTVYWIIRNVIMFIQEIILNRVMPQEKLVREATVEMEEHRKKYLGRQKKEHVVKIEDESGKTIEKKVSQKEYDKRKLAEARLRDAVKYGYAQNADDGEENGKKK